VIIGSNDPATVPDAGRQIAGAIPGAQVRYLDAAHISSVEQPAAFAEAVTTFLRA
jgi:pimeloyl-ACP methyl ester carboxylesterase